MSALSQSPTPQSLQSEPVRASPPVAGNKWNRRRFLKMVAAVAAPAVCYGFAQKPLRLGIIGLGVQGRRLARQIQWMRPLYHYGSIVAYCDVDRRRVGGFRENPLYHGAEGYQDYRRVIGRDDIDAVIIATPDHWHAAMSIEAMQAGKAVYCEKPLALTVAEGQLLREAVRQSGAVFQVGTMQRSDPVFRTACELVRNGRLGEIRKVTVTLPPATAGGPFATASPPPELDWDLWLGQAPEVPYCPERCHYNYRWWWDYSGGIMTDWGAHQLDIVHWALGCDDSGPLSVQSKAELPDIPNGYTVPTAFQVQLQYPGGVLVEISPEGDRLGILFEGTRGRIFVNRGGVFGKPYDDLHANPLPEDAVRLNPHMGWMGTSWYRHLRDFFDCVRTGRQPVSDVSSQHRSTTACHIANISMRLGKTLRWDAVAETFPDDAQARALLSRRQRAPYLLPPVSAARSKIS